MAIRIRFAEVLAILVMGVLACAQAQSPAEKTGYRIRASELTLKAEERIWRLDAVEQPVAWARLFALWHDSGDRRELQRRFNLPWSDIDLDKELDCGRIQNVWIQRALQGISRRGETPTQRRQRNSKGVCVVHVRRAYRTLEEFGTDDSETLISFVNGAAGTMDGADAAEAVNRALNWLNDVPHPAECRKKNGISCLDGCSSSSVTIWVLP